MAGVEERGTEMENFRRDGELKLIGENTDTVFPLWHAQGGWLDAFYTFFRKSCSRRIDLFFSTLISPSLCSLSMMRVTVSRDTPAMSAIF